MNGYWNMKDKKVINGAKISNWACLNFCEYLSKKDIKEFCFKLAEMSHITGVEFANLKLPIFTARPDQVEDGIHKCYQEAKNKLKDQKIDLLLAILPDKNGSLYGSVYDGRHNFFTSIGLVSQEILKGSVRQILVSCHSVVKGQMSSLKIVRYWQILLLRSMPRLEEGIQYLQKSLPVVSNKPTIIFGAHVSHPSKKNMVLLPLRLLLSLHPKTGMRCLSIITVLFVHKVTLRRSVALKTLSRSSFMHLQTSLRRSSSS